MKESKQDRLIRHMKHDEICGKLMQLAKDKDDGLNFYFTTTTSTTLSTVYADRMHRLLQLESAFCITCRSHV